MTNDVIFRNLPKNNIIAVQYNINNETKYVISYNEKTEIYTLFDIVNGCINQKLGTSENPLLQEMCEKPTPLGVGWIAQIKIIYK